MDNLLSTFHRRFRPGQKKFEEEDLFTECLAWLLNRSAAFREQFASLFLADWDDCSTEVFREADAQTQVPIDGGRWDLTLSAESHADANGVASDAHLLVVESKMGAQPLLGQLQRYHDELERRASDYSSIHLGLLTKESQKLAHLDSGEFPYWTENVFWSQVQRVLTEQCDAVHARLCEENDAEAVRELAEFLSIGRQFGDLLEEKGLVLPQPIAPREDHQRYVAGEMTDDRFRDFAKLIIRALESGGAEDIVLQAGLVLRQTKGEPRVYDDVQRWSHLNRLRRIYRFPDHSHSFVTFGLLLDYPTESLQRRGENNPNSDYSIELACGLEIERSTSPRAFDWLMAEEDGGTRLDHVAESLKSRSPAFPGATPVFIPADTSWSKLAWRASTEGWEDLDVEEQVDRMGAFFREFAVMLTRRPVPPYTNDGEGLLDLLHRVHQTQ